jgi:hypothetical protein
MVFLSAVSPRAAPCQLDQRHDREGHIFTGCTLGDFAQYLPCIAALALCRDELAGVEY